MSQTLHRMLLVRIQYSSTYGFLCSVRFSPLLVSLLNIPEEIFNGMKPKRSQNRLLEACYLTYSWPFNAAAALARFRLAGLA